MENAYSSVPIPRQDKLNIAVAFILYFISGVVCACIIGHAIWFVGALTIGVLGSYLKSDISKEVEINLRLVLKTIGEDLL